MTGAPDAGVTAFGRCACVGRALVLGVALCDVGAAVVGAIDVLDGADDDGAGGEALCCAELGALHAASVAAAVMVSARRAARRVRASTDSR